MALIVVLVFLFAGWMFWGWMVSEHRDIAWMKKWCAILFILTAMLICTGTGAGVTLVVLKKKQRAEVVQFARMLDAQLRQGSPEQALQELQSVIDSPDEWSTASSDPLKRMLSASERMQQRFATSDTEAAAIDSQSAGSETSPSTSGSVQGIEDPSISRKTKPRLVESPVQPIQRLR